VRASYAFRQAAGEHQKRQHASVRSEKSAGTCAETTTLLDGCRKTFMISNVSGTAAGWFQPHQFAFPFP
jgi:hypothetical protein